MWVIEDNGYDMVFVKLEDDNAEPIPEQYSELPKLSIESDKVNVQHK